MCVSVTIYCFAQDVVPCSREEIDLFLHTYVSVELGNHKVVQESHVSKKLEIRIQLFLTHGAFSCVSETTFAVISQQMAWSCHLVVQLAHLGSGWALPPSW